MLSYAGWCQLKIPSTSLTGLSKKSRGVPLSAVEEVKRWRVTLSAASFSNQQLEAIHSKSDRAFGDTKREYFGADCDPLFLWIEQSTPRSHSSGIPLSDHILQRSRCRRLVNSSTPTCLNSSAIKPLASTASVLFKWAIEYNHCRVMEHLCFILVSHLHCSQAGWRRAPSTNSIYFGFDFRKPFCKS